ncbi:hypothetical protein [Streptacidiphilus sp. P02-A3a]|uniref:hypothetical protein n=1 Tax=Streptacidiphilus sp. P02-A3a TaxID=2704468 RepID=UPI0015F8CD6A|nr:hypothetical protein [Streptacidiphilus sp. P02-A3a]QMU70480.1 hypothetical protein GXP74_22020 [Streptacidiphilus sp. P02-A3a]
MRVPIAASVLTGVLALGAVAVPTTAFAATAKPVITKAVSQSVVLGLSGTVTLGVTVTAADASGIKAIYAEPYPVALAAQAHAVPTAADLKGDPADDLLKVRSHTATTQTAGIRVSEKVPSSAGLPNDVAGVWGVAVLVVAKDGATTFNAKATSYTWQRADKLTAKTSATQLRKGAALTVKGQLNRVDWAAHAYRGYAARPVLLQFRKSGSAAWTTAGRITSSRTGALSATVKDNATGYWRFVFTGNSTSGQAASTPIRVSVK